MAQKKTITLVFLKLGGSLLGDKSRRNSFRAATVKRIGGEIHRSLQQQPGLRVLLAHGGGAPAHFPAAKYRTREGLAGGGGWRGFAETRRGVLEMNRRVIDALAQGGLHPILLAPSASLVADEGRIVHWNIRPLRLLLEAGQIPLIHGDAVLDRSRGFTICSTEQLFAYLTARLHPDRLLLACDVKGVYLDERGRTRILPCVNGANIAQVLRALRRTRSSRSRRDVTGGMAAKVQTLYRIVCTCPRVQAEIISGLQPGAIEKALIGESSGTRIER